MQQRLRIKVSAENYNILDMKGKTMFSNFQEVSAKAWKQKIQYDLKGKDYNDEVVWDAPEGIKVKPFYHADDINNRKIGSNLTPSHWNIGLTIFAGNGIMANEKALKFLGKGAEAIQFVIPTYEVDILSLLNNINLREVKVYFKMQFLSKIFMAKVFSEIKDAANIHFQTDLISNLSRTGNWYASLEKDHLVFDDLIGMHIPNLISVDTVLYENAGANSVQQLAYALAHANEYLNHLADGDQIKSLKCIQFNVAVGGNYFFEIAKIKALRMLWKTLAAVYDITFDCHITATPSKRNKTIYDYNVNMLRTTTECMSAVLGGADTVFNLSYDSIYHKDNDFAERIALNQLILLKEESHFDKVSNPAEGSYYIESLTEQLAEKALVLFKSIEKNGGFLSGLKSHSIQNKIQESARKQQEQFNTGEDVLVGTNKYQNLEDRMKADLELFPFVKKNPRKTLIVPIIEKRLSEELEQNRLKDE